MKLPVFLSASFPVPERGKIYWGSRQLLNLRESVRELTALVLPHGPLVFGGHPTINPLIRGVAERLAHDMATREGQVGFLPEDRILLYLSQHFAGKYPAEVASFKDVVETEAMDQDGQVITPGSGSRARSLLFMRYRMIGHRDVQGDWLTHFRNFVDRFGETRRDHFKTDRYRAAFFFGGMSGVEKEFNIFRSFHPHTPVFPIATTGSAAKRLLERNVETFRHEGLQELLAGEEVYGYLFERLFAEFANWLPPGPGMQELHDHLESGD